MPKLYNNSKFACLNINALYNSDKERSGRPAAVKDKSQKDGKKSWKMMENTSINLLLYCIDFFIVIKKSQKISKNFCTDLILLIYIIYTLRIYIHIYIFF